jgi:hypothetical protein
VEIGYQTVEQKLRDTSFSRMEKKYANTWQFWRKQNAKTQMRIHRDRVTTGKYTGQDLSF